MLCANNHSNRLCILCSIDRGYRRRNDYLLICQCYYYFNLVTIYLLRL